MESHELIHQALKKAQAKNVAKAVRRSVSTVYKWAKAKADGGTNNLLDWMLAYLEETRHLASLQWLCRQKGGTFVPDLAGQNPPPTLNLATKDATAALANCITTVAEITASGAKDPATNERYLAALQEVKARCGALALGLQQDIYTKLPLLCVFLRWLLTGEMPELLERG
jgi:hypothetical protein